MALGELSSATSNDSARTRGSRRDSCWCKHQEGTAFCWWFWRYINKVLMTGGRAVEGQSLMDTPWAQVSSCNTIRAHGIRKETGNICHQDARGTQESLFFDEGARAHGQYHMLWLAFRSPS